MKLIDFLSTPFPRPHANKTNVIWVVLIGLGCSLFILLYKPFGIVVDPVTKYVQFVIISLGLLFSFSIILLEWIGPKIFYKFFNNWTVGKAIIWYPIVILIVAINIFFYKHYLSGFKEIAWVDFIYVLFRILAISVTVSFFIFGFWNYFKKQRITKLTSQSQYTIIPQSGKPFKINLSDIVYIKSDDNYVDFFLWNDNQLKKQIVRSSLKNIESQIVNSISPMIRCHRGFLINLNYFKIKQDKSRQMIISSTKDDSIEIPVSIKYESFIRSNL